MKTGRRRNVKCGIAVAVGVLVTAITNVATARCAAAEATEPRLLVYHIDPAVLQTNAAPLQLRLSLETRPQTPSSFPHWQIPATSRTSTSLERWQSFESEYGIQGKETSPVLSTVRSAKYQLDRTAFAVQEFSRSLEFDYKVSDLWKEPAPNRSPTRNYSDPILDAVENMRLKSQVNLIDKQTGSAFVGLKLSMPIGD